MILLTFNQWLKQFNKLYMKYLKVWVKGCEGKLQKYPKWYDYNDMLIIEGLWLKLFLK